MHSRARKKWQRKLEISFGGVRSAGLACTQRIEVEMHIHGSRGSVPSFSVNQYTLAQGNEAEDTPGCVLLLDHAEV